MRSYILTQLGGGGGFTGTGECIRMRRYILQQLGGGGGFTGAGEI